MIKPRNSAQQINAAELASPVLNQPSRANKGSLRWRNLANLANPLISSIMPKGI